MAWLWEDYNANGLYHVDWQPWAPALEITAHDPGAVNIIPRFMEFFLPLQMEGLDDATRRQIENALLHILAQLDIACGLDFRELAMRRLIAELDGGLWGAEEARLFLRLDANTRGKVASLLYDQEKTGIMRLDRALKIWFPGSRAWRLEKTGELILGISAAPNEANRNLLKLILHLFLPLRLQQHTFWLQTPCILDCPEAALDSCVLA